MRYSEAFIKYTKTLAAPQYEPLSQVRERELLKALENGTTDAFNVIVNAYLRFVIFLLKLYKIPDDIDIMDIVQEGNMGLMHGLSKFDSVKYPGRVSTYCVHWIKFFMNKALSSQASLRNMFVYLDNSDIEDAPSDITSNSSYYAWSHDLWSGAAGDISQDIVDYVMTTLNDREKLVIVYFYGLRDPFVPKTLQEIASILHIHIERVRQLRDTALAKIDEHLLSQIAHTQ